MQADPEHEEGGTEPEVRAPVLVDAAEREDEGWKLLEAADDKERAVAIRCLNEPVAEEEVGDVVDPGGQDVQVLDVEHDAQHQIQHADRAEPPCHVVRETVARSKLLFHVEIPAHILRHEDGSHEASASRERCNRPRTLLPVAGDHANDEEVQRRPGRHVSLHGPVGVSDPCCESFWIRSHVCFLLDQSCLLRVPRPVSCESLSRRR
mmetsp:Transcript_51604/g.121099  ORF Transcript_51604/g.121099 Transcript_51604/m.121099 type:complete len:207 (-) Transcript_51604:12-632(-)